MSYASERHEAESPAAPAALRLAPAKAASVLQRGSESADGLRAPDYRVAALDDQLIAALSDARLALVVATRRVPAEPFVAVSWSARGPGDVSRTTSSRLRQFSLRGIEVPEPMLTDGLRRALLQHGLRAPDLRVFLLPSVGLDRLILDRQLAAVGAAAQQEKVVRTIGQLAVSADQVDFIVQAIELEGHRLLQLNKTAPQTGGQS